MEVVLLIVLIVAIVGLGVLQWLLRGPRAAPPATPIASEVLPAEPSSEPDRQTPELTLAADEVLVLPPSSTSGSAVVVGPAASLAALQRAGLIRPREQRRPLQQLVDRVAVFHRDGERRRLDTLAQDGLEGGYLKLTPESRRQLAENPPVISKTGDMLGMVNDERGRRKALLRFTDYTTCADPNLVLAAANMRAMAGLQEQLEAIEDRLIEVQKTLETLAAEIDRERLAEITAATEMLEEVAANVRRRGHMTDGDWDQVVETRHIIKTHLGSARFNLTDLTRDFAASRSRHRRVEVLETLLKESRIEYWLTMFVEAQLAHTRSDLLTLLYEATRHPDTLGDLEARIRQGIETRRDEMALAGTLLRDLADPQARRFVDHLQQVSRFKLARRQPIITSLLEAHGDVFAEAPPITVPARVVPAAS